MAFGPQDALSYKSPEYAAALAKLSAQRVQVRALDLGLSGTATANRRDTGDEYIMGFSWSRSPVAITQAKQAEELAKRELVRLARESGRVAMLAHADLWEAQMVRKAAETRAQSAEMRRQEAERKQGLGAISALDVESARLDQAEAQLEQRRAQELLTSALNEATRYGLQGDADQTTARFKVAEAKLEDLPAYHDAKWDVSVAGAQQKEARRNNAPAFGINALYQRMETTIQANASTRGPNMDVTTHYQPINLTLPGLYTQFVPKPGWQILFQVDLPLNPAGRAERRVAAANLSLAKTRLQERGRDLPIEVAKAQTELLSAQERLQLARERHELDLRRTAIVHAQAEAGAVSKLAVLDAEATQADNNATYARAWKNYITAAAAYLELVGGTWEVEP